MIGSWWCLPEAKLGPAALERYAAAGFSCFQTLDRADDTWRPYSRDGNRRALELCQRAGLDCLVVDARLYRGARPYPVGDAPSDAEIDAVVADYAASPALAGYLLYDEPSPHAFAALAGTIARLRERDAARVALVPLFPMHQDTRFPDAFEGRSYEQYLREFVATCHPAVLAYDYYPFFDPPSRLPEYDLNFAIARQVAADAAVPLWYYGGIVSGGPGGLRPTLGRVRYQANLALAHGARAILHYTYASADRLNTRELTLMNREIADQLTLTRDWRVFAVETDREATRASFGAAAPSHLFVVNRDPEADRRIDGLDLPPGGAALVPLR